MDIIIHLVGPVGFVYGNLTDHLFVVNMIFCHLGPFTVTSMDAYLKYMDCVQMFDATVSAVLVSQVYTSHGPTVIMPTWFCSRNWFRKVGPFDEGGKVRVTPKISNIKMFHQLINMLLPS